MSQERPQCLDAFDLRWDIPGEKDPRVFLGGKNVTDRCAWIRLDPGGTAMAGLYRVDSTGHYIGKDGNTVIEEIFGPYFVQPRRP